MKKKPAIFATDRENRLYVLLEAVMHPMVAMCDGISIVRFGDEKLLYLKIDDAIEWCRKEAKAHSREKYETMISVMEKAKRQEAGPQ